MSERHQLRRLQMLKYLRDRLERQLAAINASLKTLEGQIERDKDELSTTQ